jgi:hypothetical protein
MVGSYSRHDAPKDSDKSGSSPLVISKITVSNGFDNFRTSHHLTWNKNLY